MGELGRSGLEDSVGRSLSLVGRLRAPPSPPWSKRGVDYDARPMLLSIPRFALALILWGAFHVALLLTAAAVPGAALLVALMGAPVPDFLLLPFLVVVTLAYCVFAVISLVDGELGLVAFATVGLALFVGFFGWLVPPEWSTVGTSLLYGLLWLTMAGVAMVGFGVAHVSLAHHHVRQAAAASGRGYALLLRSFADTDHMVGLATAPMVGAAGAVTDVPFHTWPYHALVPAIRRYAWPVAIGQFEHFGLIPSPHLVPCLIRTRGSDDADWQRLFAELAPRSSMIVIQPGSTPGVLWELDAVIARDLLDRVVFFMPPANGFHRAKTRDAWNAASVAYAERGVDLPRYSEHGALVRLEDSGRWTAIYVDGTDKGWRRAVRWTELLGPVPEERRCRNVLPGVLAR